MYFPSHFNEQFRSFSCLPDTIADRDSSIGVVTR